MRQSFRCLLAAIVASAMSCDSDPPTSDAASDRDAAADSDAAEDHDAAEDADADAGADADAVDDADASDDADAGDAETHRASDGGADVEAGPPIPCDAVAPTSCPMPAPVYGDVAPVIEMRCLSCHDGLGDQWPLTSYEHVVSWTDQIRGMMLSCSMPPPDAGIEMPLEERQLLLSWLRCNSPR